MELFNALKKVVDLQTQDILKDIKLINILSDFKAYDEYPPSKYLLKYMISEGLMANLLFEYQSSSDVEILLSSHSKLLSDTYGFKENLSDYVIRCIAYSLGWINDIPTIIAPSSSETNKIEIQEEPIVDDGKHLLFKQFPITGDVKKFIQSLISSGYTMVEPYNYTYSAASLRGSFAGNNDCSIVVLGTPKSHITCCVMVFLQEHHIWYTIKDQYEKIKSQLTKKYGTPESYEYFMDPYYEGDGSELTALFSDHCTYLSMFNTSNGKITVSMTSEAKVMIAYQDKINIEIKDSESNSLAHDDL
jgi:hypothetical protein